MKIFYKMKKINIISENLNLKCFLYFICHSPSFLATKVLKIVRFPYYLKTIMLKIFQFPYYLKKIILRILKFRV